MISIYSKKQVISISILKQHRLQDFNKMSILSFLDEASEIGTLVQIRREVYGDAEDVDDDD